LFKGLPGKRFFQVQFWLPGKFSRERNFSGSKKSSREEGSGLIAQIGFAGGSRAQNSAFKLGQVRV